MHNQFVTIVRNRVVEKFKREMTVRLTYLEVGISLHYNSDGFLSSRLHSCVLLLGVLEEERQNGGEERVRERLQS